MNKDIFVERGYNILVCICQLMYILMSLREMVDVIPTLKEPEEENADAGKKAEDKHIF